MGRVTLGQVEELALALSISDQQLLMQKLGERLTSHQEYFARAEQFLQTCVENPVPSAMLMDAGAECADMRNERGNELV